MYQCFMCEQHLAHLFSISLNYKESRQTGTQPITIFRIFARNQYLTIVIMKQIIIPFILLSLASCGHSKEELQHQIDIKSDSIFILKQVINEQSSHIEELQEKLDNTKSYVEDVQAALEDGSFSDAYDAASYAESEAEYEDY